jgi:hypothetical protein
MKIELCFVAAAAFLGSQVDAATTMRVARVTKGPAKIATGKKAGATKLGALDSAKVKGFMRLLLPRADIDAGDPATKLGTYGKVAGGRMFVNGVNMKDVAQGQLGDCFFAAALAAVAYTHPEVLKKALTVNKDGTYSLRLFHRTPDGKLAADNVKMDASLPLNGGVPVYAHGTNPKQLWPAFMQKGYAAEVAANEGQPIAYQAIDKGGMPGDAFEALTGVPSQSYAISPQTADQMFTVMQHAVAGKFPAAAWTPPKVPKGVVYADHTYTILGVSEHGGQKFVKLRNPWGEDPGTDGIFELDLPTFAKTFSNLAVGG